jgi:hypothetical protein
MRIRSNVTIWCAPASSPAVWGYAEVASFRFSRTTAFAAFLVSSQLFVGGVVADALLRCRFFHAYPLFPDHIYQQDSIIIRCSSILIGHFYEREEFV